MSTWFGSGLGVVGVRSAGPGRSSGRGSGSWVGSLGRLVGRLVRRLRRVGAGRRSRPGSRAGPGCSGREVPVWPAVGAGWLSGVWRAPVHGPGAAACAAAALGRAGGRLRGRVGDHAAVGSVPVVLPTRAVPPSTSAVTVSPAAAVAARALPGPVLRNPTSEPSAVGATETGTSAEVRRGGAAEQERGQQAAQVGVDLDQLEVDRGAGTAALEVGRDPRGVAAGEAGPDVGAEVGAGGLAGRARLTQVVHVHGHERLAEPLAGAVRELGDGVGAEAEQRRDLGGPLALDLGVPQHELPALGQRGERPGGRAADSNPATRGVAERQPRVEDRLVVGGPGAG